MPNRYPLREEQFRQLPIGPGWTLNDVPRELWYKIPALVRIEDTLAIMASGSTGDPRILDDIKAIAKVEQLVHETRPRFSEPEGNAYHFVIQKIRHSEYPFLMHGPYRWGTVVPHWFDADDLDRYWKG
jgi:hypothetical protein